MSYPLIDLGPPGEFSSQSRNFTNFWNDACLVFSRFPRSPSYKEELGRRKSNIKFSPLSPRSLRVFLVLVFFRGGFPISLSLLLSIAAQV